MADLAGDSRLLAQAQQAAKELLEADPDLSWPKHHLLRERVRALFAENPEIFN